MRQRSEPPLRVGVLEAPGVVARILADRTGAGPRGPRRTVWVGLDGLGGAGKSHLAAVLAAALPASHVVGVDAFARPGVRGWDRDRFVDQVVRPLLAGRAGRYQRWDFAGDVGTDWVRVPASVPVIVEGVSATDRRLPVPWDLRVWLDAPADLRRERIEARDGPAWRERWEQDWWPSEQAYVAEQDPVRFADLVVRAG